jgi:acyl-coenzyme A synthetase/AMP-(fatty) acid ligase
VNIIEPIARYARVAPDAPAIIAGQRTLTYGALMRDVAVASTRLAQEGVRRGDVVGIVAKGLAGHVLATLAIARIGAVSAPFGHMPAQDMSYFAQVLGADVVVYNDADAPRIEASGIRKQLSLSALVSARPETVVPQVRCDPDDLFRFAFSSGTTGRQKPVKFTHGNMTLRTHLTRTVFPTAPGQRIMVGLPVGLHFSLGYILLGLLWGGTLVDRGDSFEATAEAIRTHKVNLLLTSPGNAVGLAKLAQAGAAHATPSPDLQALCIGGARVAPTLQALLRQYVCPNLYINYGMTEGGGVIAQADTALLQSNPASAGRLMPWVEVEPVDDSGNPLPPGSYGRLRLRSPCLADGYIGVDPEGTEAFRDGWFYSGDVGTVTEDGLVFLRGRADVLNVGGTKVSAEAVEAVIAEDPAILECAALTMLDRMQQPQLVAIVVSPQGFDADALRQRCAKSLGPTLAPKVVITADSLPHNPAGKIQRQELPALVARHMAAPRATGAAPAG